MAAQEDWSRTMLQTKSLACTACPAARGATCAKRAGGSRGRERGCRLASRLLLDQNTSAPYARPWAGWTPHRLRQRHRARQRAGAGAEPRGEPGSSALIDGFKNRMASRAWISPWRTRRCVFAVHTDGRIIVALRGSTAASRHKNPGLPVRQSGESQHSASSASSAARSRRAEHGWTGHTIRRRL